MAEIKTGIFAKNVQKRLSRAQEKVLQKLGKADETKDEQFEQCVQNFKRQETEGSRLQREMKAYLTAVKGMQQASMNLTESLHEVYEPDWYGKDDVMTIGKSCDALWEDFHQKLVDSSLITLDTYLAQFPDIKNRVAKRSRKLIDYDSARHHLETLQAGTIRNERKISKVELLMLHCQSKVCLCLQAEEEFQKAQKVFDELNVDLQEELPSLWESRVGFYVNTFKNITNLESKFHREIAMLCHKLYEVMTKLGEQHSDKMFTIQGAPSDSGPLRLARTPSPTEDESPPGSPEAAPNHTLRPTSPGPPRPKSPSQLKKGPPVPPPPKVTPTKELHQEQIINLFDDNFVPEISVTVPAQVSANHLPGGDSGEVLDFVTDPFAEPPVAGDATWTSDPFAGDQNHMWPENWEPMAGGDTWGFPGAPEGHANGFAQWSAFPDPAADKDATGGGSPWHEVSGSSGFFSSDGQGDFASSWGDSDQRDDPFATTSTSPTKDSPTTPGSQFEGQSPRNGGGSGGGGGGGGETSSHKETENNNSDLSEDELDLKRGDLVLVVPTELAEDQDAGWLTGLKEADWLQQGSSAQKGLFPENFTQRLE
uniref:Amphiphysin n=1 Tax=Scleropages formosus TaxID=113540 RepID=A0A8C9SX74_SCLFO